MSSHLDIIPTEWVHDPRTGFECIVNSCDVPQYQGRGYIRGTIEDERGRVAASKAIQDALKDVAAGVKTPVDPPSDAPADPPADDTKGKKGKK